MTKFRHLKFALGVVGALALASAPGARADEQFFPLQSYRVGPYAAGGTGFFGGFIDYLNLINIRDGGVNGVKLTWDEGETQYEVERGVEVYERLKNRPGVAAWNPLSVGIAYAMLFDYQFLIEVLVGGLLSGVMYSLAAIGFVVIYKTSGVDREQEFAHGGVREVAGRGRHRSPAAGRR